MGARCGAQTAPSRLSASGQGLRRQARPAHDWSAGLLTVPAALLTLTALVGCTASTASLTPPSPAAPQATVSRPAAPTSGAGSRLTDPGDSCALYAAAAAAAATITAAGGSLGQSRQAAARSYGTPRLQALYDGTGQGRDPQQELWQQHHARVLAHAQPVVVDLHHDDAHDESTVVDHQARAPAGAEHAAVIVTGSARGDGGWTAPVSPYRLECLLLADPVRGWLVDDLVTDPLSTPAATPAPTASR